ncbi:hypothetical protein DVS77_21865 [Mycolicibacterium moriokaense]|nr:hypothetical protein DVS77_21865 [Mycolicibacterium moriokaense]
MNCWSRTSARIGVTCALAVATLAACANDPTAATGGGSDNGPAPLNGVSAAQLVDSFVKAGLPAANRQDVTDERCPKLHCAQAVSTDTVTTMKFPATGLAQRYAGSISNVYQVEDLVVVFAPTVTAAQKQDYEAVAKKAAA